MNKHMFCMDFRSKIFGCNNSNNTYIITDLLNHNFSNNVTISVNQLQNIVYSGKYLNQFEMIW